MAGVRSAEVYAAELGFADGPSDERLLLAEQFVKGLFFVWATRVRIAKAESAPRRDPSRWCPECCHRAWDCRVSVQLGIGPPVTCSHESTQSFPSLHLCYRAVARMLSGP